MFNGLLPRCIEHEILRAVHKSISSRMNCEIFSKMRWNDKHDCWMLKSVTYTCDTLYHNVRAYQHRRYCITYPYEWNYFDISNVDLKRDIPIKRLAEWSRKLYDKKYWGLM